MGGFYRDSLLNDRQQYVMIHDHISSTNRGIPQGSILGTLLFLIYMFTDLFHSSILIINLAVILFAGDTNFSLTKTPATMVKYC